MKLSWIRAFVPIFVLVYANGALAAPNLFVWDFGPVAGRADAGDVVMDITQDCGKPEAYLNFPGGKLAGDAMPEWVPVTGQAAHDEYFRLAPRITHQRDIYNLISVVDSHKGSKETLFVLMPELHNALGAESEKNQIVLNMMRTLFAVGITAVAETRGGVLNLSEGERDYDVERLRVNVDRSLPLVDQARDVFMQGYRPPFFTIFNVFKAPGVTSAFVDSPGMLVTQSLLLHDPEGTLSFDEVFEKIMKWNPAAKREAYESAYRSLQTMTKRQRDQEAVKLCDLRSFTMIDYAVSMVEEKKPSLVILRYGSSHHKHMTEVLKGYGFSYYAVVPILRQ